MRLATVITRSQRPAGIPPAETRFATNHGCPVPRRIEINPASRIVPSHASERKPNPARVPAFYRARLTHSSGAGSTDNCGCFRRPGIILAHGIGRLKANRIRPPIVKMAHDRLRTVQSSEIEPGPLGARRNRPRLDVFPLWGNLHEFRGRPPFTSATLPRCRSAAAWTLWSIDVCGECSIRRH